MSINQREVQRLPEETVAAIRSSFILATYAACVEELVQNSIDAGSTRIEISINRLQWAIGVSDNGSGIFAQDMQNIDTSKTATALKVTEDMTYGFRGEALASIGEVGLLEVISRHKDNTQTYSVLIKGGRQISRGFTGTDRNRFTQGTTIQVRDLFYKWPVRRKTAMCDAVAIRNAIERLSLAWPHIVFVLTESLSEGTQSLLNVKTSNSVQDRWRALFGPNLVNTSDTIESRQGCYDIHGFISVKAALNKQYQFIYINNRYLASNDMYDRINELVQNSDFASDAENEARLGNIDSPVKRARTTGSTPLRKAVKYFPAFCLQIRMPTEKMDLYLEPEKKVLLVKDEAGLTKAVTTVFDDFLSRHSFSPFKHATPRSKALRSPKTPTKTIANSAEFSDGVNNLDQLPGTSSETKLEPIPATNLATTCRIYKRHLNTARVVAQWQAKVIITTVKTEQDGMSVLAIDQHAADERVRFENLLQDLCSGPMPVALSELYGIVISSREAELLRLRKDNLEVWGIHLVFGDPTKHASKDVQIWISHIPHVIRDRVARDPWQLRDLLTQYIAQIEQEPPHHDLIGEAANIWSRISRCPKVLIDMIASQACRSSIMFNDALEKDQCTRMIAQLAETFFPLQCAHNRTALVNLVDVDKHNGLCDRGATMPPVQWASIA